MVAKSFYRIDKELFFFVPEFLNILNSIDEHKDFSFMELRLMFRQSFFILLKIKYSPYGQYSNFDKMDIIV